MLFDMCTLSGASNMGVGLMVVVLFLNVWHFIHVFYIFSFSTLIFPLQGQSCDCSSCGGHHQAPSDQGSPCGFDGGSWVGRGRRGSARDCWLTERTVSQLDCPLSGETLCGHSSVCPSCQDCQAAHRSVSLSESAPF